MMNKRKNKLTTPQMSNYFTTKQDNLTQKNTQQTIIKYLIVVASEIFN